MYKPYQPLVAADLIDAAERMLKKSDLAYEAKIEAINKEQREAVASPLRNLTQAFGKIERRIALERHEQVMIRAFQINAKAKTLATPENFDDLLVNEYIDAELEFAQKAAKAENIEIAFDNLQIITARSQKAVKTRNFMDETRERGALSSA